MTTVDDRLPTKTLKLKCVNRLGPTKVRLGP
jgi:hypothetical protein